jgi:hypothetical protein
MQDGLSAFGLGADDLSAQVEAAVYPERVPGRIAHIDADFIAYQASAETKDELDGIKPRRTFKDMQEIARRKAEHFMRLVGASEYRMHITPPGSTKGGRYQQAVQREYQGNRNNKASPEHLDLMRAFIGEELNGVVHLDQEADDGMTQANYAAMSPDGAWGQSNLSVIVSMDKDLRMVPGLHYDFDTGKIFCVGDRFGSVWIDESGSSKKLRGWGTKFFWAQCLMGDTADNIRGVPLVPSKYAAGKPTQRGKACGPVLTYALLKDVYNDRDCFHFVRKLYTEAHTEVGYEYKHWATDEPVTPTQALLGDMLLLWMRRNKNPNDVIEWLKGVTQ